MRAKNNNVKLIPLIMILCICIIGCTQYNKSSITPKENAREKTDLFLLGTFHFDNPGLDMVKTKSFDILSNKAQNDLEDISNDIAIYAPTKIFKEWPHYKQAKID